MIHLIGVDHVIQHSGYMNPEKNHAITDFQSYLCEQARSLGATLLAEEFSADALQLNSVSISTVGQVAQELGVRHLFCDPGRAERNRLGISTHDEREAYWLEQLRPFEEDEIIFVCGDDHISSFPNVLHLANWTCRVLTTGWGRALNPMRRDGAS